MRSKFIGFVVFSMLLGIMSTVGAQETVTITWFVGLGTGGNPEQRAMQDSVVQRFNDSHDNIELEIVIVENEVSVETLATLIATGEAPDIVGPVGFAGTNAFRGSFLDIQPYVEASGYDLTQFPEAAVEFQRTEDGLLGLPLANFPSLLFYRPALFDEAGLEYPPDTYGKPYMLYGEEVEWNTETLRQVAMILTVDAAGNDATSPEFDAENIIQWGYMPTSGTSPMREYVNVFGAGSLYQTESDGSYTATFPESWRPAFQWWYDGMWTDHFIPTRSQMDSELLGTGDGFASGNIAMTQSHLWYTCCLEGDSAWNAAALPSYNGQVTSKLHADTFRILSTTEHPAEAFEVLAYLTGEASLDLLSVYGGMPARHGDQAAFFATLDEQYPQGVNWDVVREGLNYPDIPSHEEWLPNNNPTNDRLDTFRSLLESTAGVDVNAEIDTLTADLQVIYDEPAQ